ncbi:nucleoside-diphosphate kinase [Enterococcus olivae]
MQEQTLVIIKPDGVQRQLVGKIFQQLEAANLSFSSLKMETLSREILKQHYQHLTDKPFFPTLLDYMTEGPVVLMVVEGEQAVARVRQIVGATDPLKAEMGSLRAAFGVNQTRNLVHASDSVEAAKEEIQRFFGK